MRAGFKITMKLGMIGAFLFCTPFFDGMRQLIEESSFLNLLVVRQEVSVSDFSLKHQLNVMSVPQKKAIRKMCRKARSLLQKSHPRRQ